MVSPFTAKGKIVDASQEMVALGMCNIMGSHFRIGNLLVTVDGRHSLRPPSLMKDPKLGSCSRYRLSGGEPAKQTLDQLVVVNRVQR